MRKIILTSKCATWLRKHVLLRLGCSNKHVYSCGNKCLWYFCFHLTWVVCHHIGKGKEGTWDQLQLCSSQLSGAIALILPCSILWRRHDMNEEHAVSSEKWTPLSLLYFLSLFSASSRDPVLQKLLCIVSLILLSRAFGTVWLWCFHNSGLKETWHFKLASMEGTLYWQNSIFWVLRILFASFGLSFFVAYIAILSKHLFC